MVEVQPLCCLGEFVCSNGHLEQKSLQEAKELSLGYPSRDVHSKTEYTNLEVIEGGAGDPGVGTGCVGSLRKA